jgi:hypothetical protein
MDTLGLKPDEFRYLVQCCQRVLLTTNTTLEDLRYFLTTHLMEHWPQTATRIRQFDDRQMATLRDEILTAMQDQTESVLWDSKSLSE